LKNLFFSGIFLTFLAHVVPWSAQCEEDNPLKKLIARSSVFKSHGIIPAVDVHSQRFQKKRKTF